ncbi:MAG TPA: hypothetical protein VJU82_17055 [Acidobacteriaceae bacterium]|nr:hypothetical protein [Acidobacteriaceae bacterium]
MADELFDELTALANTTSAPAGTCLFRQDEPSTSVYVGRSGNIALFWPDAEEAVPMEVLTGKAIIDSEVGVISAARLLDLLEGNPAFCRTAMRMMSREVARLRSSTAVHCSRTA